MNEGTTGIREILAPMPDGDVLRFGIGSYSKLPPLPGCEAPLLRDSDLFDPEDEMDASPNAEWFIKFTERFYGRCWLIGYRVCDARDDRRVSIEGILIATDDLTVTADNLLRSKRPDETDVYVTGPQNRLDVAVARYWWD
jgi:hypothetical protein